MRFITAVTVAASFMPLAAQSASIGDYQREPINAYAPDSVVFQLGRPIGRLDMLSEDGKTSFCSAFLVDGDRFVTADFCFPGLNGAEIQAAQFVAGFTVPESNEGVDRYTVSPTPLEVNSELGFSVGRVFGNPKAKYGTVSLGDYPVPVGTPLWLIGHPQGRSQRISREGCVVLEGGTAGKALRHGCDTLAGDSAAVLFDPATGQGIGFHFAGDERGGFNIARPMSAVLAASSLLTASEPPVAGNQTSHALLDALLGSDPADLVEALDALATTDRDPSVRAKAARLLDTLRLEMVAQ